MRILVLIHEYPPVGGGGGQVARDIARGLVERGHEIRVLTAHVKGLPLVEKGDGFEVIRLPSGRTEPFRADLAPMLRYMLSATWTGMRLVREWKPDAIHAHFAVPAGPAAWSISKVTGVPYVLTAHLGDIPGGTPEKTDRWFRWVYPFAPPVWKSAAAVSAVSEYTKRLALSHYPVKIEVIPNGVDLDDPESRPIQVNSPILIVFAARFVEQKDPIRVVATLAKLQDLPWKCVMLGDGPLRREVEAEIERHNLSERFSLPGWVSPEEVISWFRRSDILFMPSRSEGLPVVGLQAMAAGLALVVSRVGGFTELVEHGTNGYLFEPNSLDEAGSLLRKLLTDPKEIIAFRSASRRMARRFSLAGMVTAYEQLFRSISKGGRVENTLRILIINSEYPPIGGGAGNASANLARCLATMGHSTAVLTARFGTSDPVEILEGVSVHRVAALRRRQDRSGAFEQLAFILASAPYASKLVRQVRPDVVLAFFGMPSGAVAWWLKRRYQIPYVISLRGGDVPGFRPYDFRLYHQIIGPALHQIWKHASAVVANSKGLEKLARKFDASVDISVIPNGVDVETYAANQRVWSPPHLLSVGRLVYQKGLDLALEALAGLKDLAWDWSIAGDGPQTAALQKRADQLDLQQRVHFLGWQTREQLVSRYQQANLFLFPSRHEGMPNAVLEAMASGLPVIATRIAGNEELVVDGVSGKLVGSEDVDMLRSGLRELIVDEHARKTLGNAARERVERDYSWETAASLYAGTLKSAAGAAR